MFKIREDYDAYLERCIEEERRQTEKQEYVYYDWKEAEPKGEE